MEQAEITLQKAVKERLEALQTNAFAVEKAWNLPEDAVRSILRGDKVSGTSLNKAQAVCRALGLEIHIAPRGALTKVPGLAEDGDQDATILAPPTGYATLVWDSSANLPGIAPIAFSDAWLLRHGIDQERHLSVWLGPAPQSAADASRLAIIDRQAKRTGGPHLWALRFSGPRIEVSQVQFDGGTPMLLPTKDRPEIRILRASSVEPLLLGRVLWFGNLVTSDPIEERPT